MRWGHETSFVARPKLTRDRWAMRRIILKLAAVATALAMSLGAPVVYGQVTVNSSSPTKHPDHPKGRHTTITPIPGVCPAAVITRSGNYELAGPVGPCPPGTDGIDIKASHVTLHLNGFSIIGAASCRGNFGIGVGFTAPMLSDVRILGPGLIAEFAFGLAAQNAADSLVKFVTFMCSTGIANLIGILSPGGEWKIQRNVFRQGVPDDLLCSILVAADDNDLVGNDANSPICLFSSNNTVVKNTVVGGFSGIVTMPGDNDNEIHANTTNNNNGQSGILIRAGSTENNITGNKSSNNTPFDMEDDNPNCDSNKWEGNHFTTTNQPTCIH